MSKRKSPKRRCERWVPVDGTPTRTAHEQGTGTLSMPPLHVPRSRVRTREPEPFVPQFAPMPPIYDPSSYDAGPSTRRSGYEMQSDDAPTTRRTGYNRVMGPARRRNVPSHMFHAVIDRGGGVQGMFQPEIVGSDVSLSTVRVRAKIAADTSGLPVAVMDDHHKVIKVYEPKTGPASTVRVPRTREYANMAGSKPIVYKGITIEKISTSHVGYSLPGKYYGSGKGRKITGYQFNIDGQTKFKDTLAEAKSYIDNY